MSTHLSADQKAQLEAALTLRQHELERTLAGHLQGRTRVEQAREALLSDAGDAPQRDSDREVDLARSDREIDELGRVSRALSRIREPGYGFCTHCGEAIPFDRLRLEPQALRCVACAALHEAPPAQPRI